MENVLSFGRRLVFLGKKRVFLEGNVFFGVAVWYFCEKMQSTGEKSGIPRRQDHRSEGVGVRWCVCDKAGISGRKHPLFTRQLGFVVENVTPLGDERAV